MKHLPIVTKETVDSLVGDMMSDEEYMETLAARVANAQPHLALAIAALAQETRDSAKSGGFMCIVYALLDKQARVDALNSLLTVHDDESPPTA